MSFYQFLTRDSRILLGMLGVVAVAMAIVTGFGICGYLRITFGSVVTAIPFLLLGIGTDDMVFSLICSIF